MNTDTGNLIDLSGLDEKKRENWYAKHPNYIEINRPLTPIERKDMKIGRNSPCGCGSGKKFKKCCWTGKYSKE